MSGPRKQQARAEATRAKLIAAARTLFARRGYAGVATGEIITAAGSTRGALYHHFADKRELFKAVDEEVAAETTTLIAAEIEGLADDPLAMLRVGVSAFLDVCTDPDIAQIAFVDAPAVLGWREWREIDSRHGLGLITAGLRLAIDAGMIAEQPVEPLGHLLLGAIGEAGMFIATSEDPPRARQRIEPALIGLLEGLRIDASG